MTKLCPRGKAAAKRKFKVYPSAYANAYASKICAGKIKDPSGVKRKDFRGPKPSGASEGEFIQKPQPPLRNKKNIRRNLSPRDIEYQKKKDAYDILTGNKDRKPRPKRMKVGMAVTAGSQSGMGRLEKSGLTKAKKGKMMIMIAIGKPKKARVGMMVKPKDEPGPKNPKPSPPVKPPIFPKKKKKAIPGDPDKRRDYLRNIQNPKSEYDKKGNLKYTAVQSGGAMKIKKVIKGLKKASKTHAGQAKTLSTIKLSRGGGAAIRGTNFKGVF